MPSLYACHFSLANLPYGVATSAQHPNKAIVSRLQDDVIFLDVLLAADFLPGLSEAARHALQQPVVNALAALLKSDQLQIRKALQTVLKDSSKLPGEAIVHVNHVQMHMPVQISDFTDFSCCEDHILNMGEIVIGMRKMPPQFWHFPLSYSGRTSTIVVSGTDIARPLGMYRKKPGEEAVFGPTLQLDYELETACIVGRPSKLGSPVSVEDAKEHIFGYVLINDWSARDILSYEAHPLGPVNSKSFGTTMSPWIIPSEALESFTKQAPARVSMPAPYLQHQDENQRLGYNWQLRAELITPDGTETVICNTRMDYAYWTFNDLVAHQTINGCSLNTGDMLGTGTVSGKHPESRGCLIEVTRGGKETIPLANGQVRTWLENGDIVRITGWAGDSPNSGVGFGECTGRILPSVAFPK